MEYAVINVDGECGVELVGRLRKDCPDLAVCSYGFDEHADIHITHFTVSPDGVEAISQTPWGEGRCRTRLLGRFNAQSLAVCIALLCANGYPLDKVLDVLTKTRPASGRMDCIVNNSEPLVVVDYAHTPNALEKALATLQEIKPQGAALWCVLGCNDNRDCGKRPLMGTAAVQGTDKAVVASNNPRLENPQDIIGDILPAVPTPECVETNCAAAICYAVRRAVSSDIILIVGKGRKDYQDIQGVKRHFSDFEVAEKALAERT